MINHKKLYHLSIKEDLVLLKPRIPHTAHRREERYTERVCFARTIEGCIMAINHHIDEEFARHQTKEAKLYVYRPIAKKRLVGHSTRDIIRNKLVHDAHITTEVWITEDVYVHCVGYIIIKNEIIESIPYYFYDNKTDEFSEIIVYKHSKILPL